ncbi:SNARE-associated protein Snapin [Clonorchis sinensis]|uniref:Biogenesis of lysosome-related organelles complex 1 subunit 7 n=1 Tax=Clonorchis sinensis TaxID=79923 RepID=A0A8T1MEP6_CLOSI|nr:SNARE-associated protein Snapin [Clonorchis sinensis]
MTTTVPAGEPPKNVVFISDSSECSLLMLWRTGNDVGDQVAGVLIFAGIIECLKLLIRLSNCTERTLLSCFSAPPNDSTLTWSATSHMNFVPCSSIDAETSTADPVSSSETASHNSQKSTSDFSKPSSGPSVVDELTSGLLSLFEPSLGKLDKAINELEVSQKQLELQLTTLAQALQRIAELQHSPIDLEPYVHSLNAYKQRIYKVHSSLRHSQDRVNSLKQTVAKVIPS